MAGYLPATQKKFGEAMMAQQNNKQLFDEMMADMGGTAAANTLREPFAIWVTTSTGVLVQSSVTSPVTLTAAAAAWWPGYAHTHTHTHTHS